MRLRVNPDDLRAQAIWFRENEYRNSVTADWFDAAANSWEADITELTDSRFGGDGPCAACGTLTNPVWFTDDVFWNDVVRSDGGDRVLCLYCFVELAEQKYAPTGWRLTPMFRWEPR